MQRTPDLNTCEEKSIIGISTVGLEGFRNYSELSVELGQGFNILTGPNAQGKTNFLEALYLLATTRLLRGQRDAEAIQDGRQRATVFAETLVTETRLSVVLERGIRKRATINGLSLPRAADLIGRLPCVCVSAADMEIVRGDPSERRLFLDLELSGRSSAYLRHLTLYKRALEQRNALLREAREYPVAAAVFEPWEQQLAEHGERIRHARMEFVGLLRPVTAALHELIGDGEGIAISYELRDSAEDAQQLQEMLGGTRQADVARGGTGIGPHRDDLTILVEGREARLYGSQGQQRTSVIALKLATLEVARDLLGVPPLLLLDDILSDLDERRRSHLVEAVLKKAGQAVLTCTEASAAGPEILNAARIFQVKAGMITVG